MIAQRRIQILRILREREGFVTLSEIAAMAGVSSKTVRNDLSVLREELPRDAALISRPNRGIRLNVSDEEFAELIAAARPKGTPFDYKARRGAAVAVLLLKQDHATLEHLGDALFLSRSAVNRAVAEAEKLLSPYGVLVRRRRGLGLSALCDEHTRRSAMWRLFLSTETGAAADEPEALFAPPERACSRLEWFLDGFDPVPVLKIVDRFERAQRFSFSDDARRLLLFHTAASVSRCRKNPVRVPLPSHPDFDMAYDRFLAESLAKLIKETYFFDLPEGETAYLQACLSMAEPQEFANAALQQSFQLQYPIVCDITGRVVDLFGRILEMDFSSDGVLYNNMFLALRSALARISRGVPVENPLLGQIRKQYPGVMTAAWSVSVLLENEIGLAVNEDELGFLALHICGAVERTPFSSQVLVLCNFGVGASRLLKLRLENSIPGLVVEDVVSARDTEKARNSDCDFIISSCPVKESFGGKDVVVADHFLSPADIAVVKEKMRSVHRRKKLRASSGNPAAPLFDGAFIQSGVRASDKKELLRSMCDTLRREGFVTTEYVDSVLSRELITSTEVTGGVAIPHGNAKYVLHPRISVAILEEPLPWFGESLVDVVFLPAFSTSGEDGGNEHLRRFYSAFIPLVESEERMKSLRRIQSPEEFADLMNALIRRGGETP